LGILGSPRALPQLNFFPEPASDSLGLKSYLVKVPSMAHIYVHTQNSFYMNTLIAVEATDLCGRTQYFENHFAKCATSKSFLSWFLDEKNKMKLICIIDGKFPLSNLTTFEKKF
jgi:hypothetical protein